MVARLSLLQLFLAFAVATARNDECAHHLIHSSVSSEIHDMLGKSAAS